MKYQALFSQKIMKNAATFMIYCSHDWVNSLHANCWVMLHALLSSADFFFSKSTFLKFFKNTVSVKKYRSRSQALRVLKGLIWVLTVLQRLADDTSRQ